ncbi:MAG: hypothetical protein ACYTGC_18735, partial [Planctomycetota bacterium]
MRRFLIMMVAILVAGPGRPAAAQSGDVRVSLDQFGVASFYRAGDFAAFRVLLENDLTEPTAVWVQVEVPNADGDIGEYGRRLTLSGAQRTVWLYAPLP